LNSIFFGRNFVVWERNFCVFSFEKLMEAFWNGFVSTYYGLWSQGQYEKMMPLYAQDAQGVRADKNAQLQTSQAILQKTSGTFFVLFNKHRIKYVHSLKERKSMTFSVSGNHLP
jgi:hypothetical protein